MLRWMFRFWLFVGFCYVANELCWFSACPEPMHRASTWVYDPTVKHLR